MKNLIKKIGLVLLGTFVLSSCSDDDDNYDKNVYKIVARDADFTNLKAAIDKAGLATTLQSSGTFTVFAPSNAAFTAFLQANGFASLEQVPTATLKEILLNHVL